MGCKWRGCLGWVGRSEHCGLLPSSSSVGWWTWQVLWRSSFLPTKGFLMRAEADCSWVPFRYLVIGSWRDGVLCTGCQAPLSCHQLPAGLWEGLGQKGNGANRLLLSVPLPLWSCVRQPRMAGFGASFCGPHWLPASAQRMGLPRDFE